MTKYDLVPCELSAPQCLDDLLPRLTFGPGAVAERSKSNTLSGAMAKNRCHFPSFFVAKDVQMKI